MALEQELEFFESHKKELLEHHKGQFALIKGAKLLGTFTTWPEAFDAGVQQFGTASFLIKMVQEEGDTVQFPALTVGAINAHS